MEWDIVGNQVLGYFLVVPRIAAAFLIVPLLTQETMPGTARNSFYVSLGIVVAPLAAESMPIQNMSAVLWPLIAAKELMIGSAIGFAFGAVFWAVGMAGNLIDTKVGSNMANLVDPLAGHQTSLTGALLSRLAAWLFMASGAFLIFIDILLTSYTLWPVTTFVPSFPTAGITYFASQFEFMMTVAILLSAPALVLMSLIDIAFGLINRYAQQLNVFMLSMPIKAWLAVWIVMLMLGVFVEVVLRSLAETNYLREALKVIF